jgi:serine/threonine protein kinase
MGQVYLADDTRLGRKVALKVLPPEFTGDPDRIRRFEQEAKAASGLNQPNILTIHEIGEIDNCHFIVSEYIEGEPLRQRMKNGGMTCSAAMDVAIQVASALSAAHAAGITHRDIKPENVMARPDGLIKVLDFGLAKLSETQSPPADSQASKLTRQSTEPGMVMGTVNYMSPEQARGLKVDHRTDIFSLGVMLYEMVAERRPFEGETTSDVIAAILQNEPPPLTSHAPNTPRELERIISKTLRKDREERYQAAKDLLLDLKSFQQESNSSAASATVERGTKRHTSRVLLALISSVALLAAVGGLFLWRSRGEAPPPVGRPRPLTTYPGFEINPALSPDGKQVAFAWNGDNQDNFDIYLRQVGSNGELRLTKNPAEDLSPAWSPNGSMIAFLRRLNSGRNELMLIPALGGRERKLTETVIGEDMDARTPALAWSPDGRWITVSHFEAGDIGQGLFLVSAQTGAMRRLTRPPTESSRDFTPAFSPDGRSLLFTRASGTRMAADIYILSLSEDFEPVGEARRLKTDERFVSSPVWTLDRRHVLYLAASNIGARDQTELRKIAVSGAGKSERVALLEGVIDEMSLGRHLVYTRFINDTDLWRAEIPPPEGQPGEPRPLISSTRGDGKPRYSPDGKKIAFWSSRSGADEIWIADGDGSNPAELTFFGGPGIGPMDWSPDSQRLVFHARPEGQADIFTIPANGGAPKRLTMDPSDDTGPSFSRDGRWIYFGSIGSGRQEIRKMPAEGGDAVTLTSIGGRMPLESHDGKTLYFRHNSERGIWKIPVEGGEATQVAGPVNGLAYAVGREGIFYSPAPNSSQKGSIRFVSFENGKIRTVVVTDHPIGGWISLSPDQRFLLFEKSGHADRDLMLIESFVVR